MNVTDYIVWIALAAWVVRSIWRVTHEVTHWDLSQRLDDQRDEIVQLTQRVARCECDVDAANATEGCAKYMRLALVELGKNLEKH